jgi:hypothetical protein
MKPKKVKSPESFEMGRLDKKTVLVATRHSFIVQERTGKRDQESRIENYYYSNLTDALRGYVRHRLRRSENKKDLDGSINSLLTMLKQIDDTVKAVGTTLAAAWEKRINDPIEAHLLGNGDGT